MPSKAEGSVRRKGGRFGALMIWKEGHVWCLLPPYCHNQFAIHNLQQFDEPIFYESGGPVVAFAAAVRVAFKKTHKGSAVEGGQTS